MFKNLVNEAILSFQLRTEGPVLVNEGSGSKIDPTLPDMSFVRCMRNGVSTVYLPGSSIKGVFRSRYEQLMRAINYPVCDLLIKDNNCNDLVKKESKKEDSPYKILDGNTCYALSCSACRFFGSLLLAGRVSFSDAYPLSDENIVLGMRHGVGISRITGATHEGALFDIETLEEGTFEIFVRLTNFALYQLCLLLWIIKDIEDGLVTFGMGGTRGNGQMRIRNMNDMLLSYKLFDADFDTGKLRGYESNDVGSEVKFDSFPFGRKTDIKGIDNIMAALSMEHSIEIKKAMDHEKWQCIYGAGRKK